jgi:hypothetical protein
MGEVTGPVQLRTPASFHSPKMGLRIA